MKKNLFIFSLLFIAYGMAFTSCKTSKAGIDKNLLHGAWSYSEVVTFDQLKEMPDFKENMETISDAEMTTKGNTEFNSNGQYSNNGAVVLHLTVAESGDKVTMQFNFRETGKWNVKDSTITKITEDGEVTAADDATKAVVAEDPSMLQELRPMKGETTSGKVEVATATMIVLNDEKTGLKMTMRKAG